MTPAKPHHPLRQPSPPWSEGTTLDKWLERALVGNQWRDTVPILRTLNDDRWARYAPIIDGWIRISLSAGKDSDVRGLLAALPKGRREAFRKPYQEAMAARKGGA